MPLGVNMYDDARLQGRNFASADSFQIISPGIVMNGLMLHLDAGNRLSYPTSGTIWYDLSNIRNNGTLVSGPTFGLGNGGHIIFDGVDDYISETVSLSDNFWQNDWTASFWVYFNTINSGGSSTDRTLIQHGTAASNSGLQISVRNSKLFFGLYNSDMAGVTTLSVNTWYNVVFTLTRNNTTQKMYINGVLDNTRSAGSRYTGTGTNTRIGGVVLGFGLTLHGLLSNCFFYNRELSYQEVQQNFDASRARFGV